MRKNYILALLATGVLPLSAFADITVGIPDVSEDLNKWNISGVSEEVKIEGGIVTLPGSQSGYPAYTVKNLPAGKYEITGKLTNAKFVVVLGSEEVAVDEDGIFKTSVSGDLTIEIKAENQALAFSFGDIKLVLKEDLSSIQNDLNQLIKEALKPATKLTAPEPEMATYVTDEVNGEDVIAEYNGLVETGAELDKKIAALTPSDKSKELEVYTQYVKEGLQGKVEAYAKAVSEYQNGIKNADDEYTKYPIGDLNDWAITLQANKEAKAKDLDAIENTSKANPGYQQQLNDLNKDIKDSGHDADPDLKAKSEAAQAAINAALVQIAENWEAEGVQEGKEEYKKVLPMTAVKAAYDALDSAYNALVSAEKRYENWLREYQKLTNAYINAQQEIKDLYNEDEPNYKERQDSVMAEGVTKVFNDAVDKLQVEYGSGVCKTVEIYNADKAVIDAAIAALEQQVTTDTDNLKAEKAALALGEGKVETLTKNLEAAQKALKDYAYQHDALDAEGKAIAEKIKGLTEELEDVYASTKVLTEADVNDTTSVDKDGKPTGFGSKVNAVQAEINTLNAKIAKANPLGYLTKALDDARTAIKDSKDYKYLESEEVSQYNINVLGIMNGSYESITDAIEQQQGIYNKDYTKVVNDDLKSILTSIQGDEDNKDCYLENGLTLAKAFADAFKQIIPAKAEADLLVDFIDNNTIKFNVTITTSLKGQEYFTQQNLVDTNGYKKAAYDYQEFAKKTIEKLVKACELSPQNAYNEVVSVSGSDDVKNLLSNIQEEKIEYLQAVMNALSTAKSYNNFTELELAINTYLKDQIDVIDAGKFAGYEDLDKLFAEVQDAFATIKSDYDKALNGPATPADPAEPATPADPATPATIADAPATPETPAVSPDTPATPEEPAEEPEVVPVDQQLIDINATAKELINKIQEVQDLIDKVVKNQDAYNTVVEKVNTIKGKEAVALKYAEDNALEPAVSTWQTMVKNNVQVAESLLKVVTPIYDKVEMNVAYTLDKTNADFYIDQLDDILAWFKDYNRLVVANEKAHDMLLDKSASVTRLVDEVNTFITDGGVDIIVKIDGKDQNAADVLKGYADELSTLDTDLYNAYKTVSCEGQDLEGTEEVPTLMDKYNALYKKINDLKGSLDEPFAQALKAANEKFIEDNWKEIQNGLLQQYHQALDDLKAYKDAVDSCTPLEEDPDIQTAIDHQPIYDYADQIQKLIADVEDLLATSWPSKINGKDNDKQHKLTEEDLAPFIGTADSIEDNLGTTFDEKVEAITKAAQTILKNKRLEFGVNLKEVLDELEGKGCDKASINAALKDANSAYKMAELVPETPLDGAPSAAYVQEIADAINALDAVKITDADMQNAAVLTFDTAAGKVEQAIAAAQKHLDEVTLPSKTALQAEIDKATADLNTLKAKDTTLDNLQGKLDDLKKIDVDAINAAIDKAVKDNQTNIANKAALDAKVSALQDSLDALNDWVKQLLVAGNFDFNLQNQIDNVTIAINEASKASKNLSDATVMAGLEAKIANVQSSINDAYKKVYQAEYYRLQDTELDEAERAYNEAAKQYEAETGNTDYPDTKPGKDFANKIAAQKEALVKASLGVGSVPTEAQQKAILDIQKALLDIQLDLGYLTADDVVAVLNEAAANAIDTINDAKKEIEGTYAETLAPEYDKLVAEVEALKAQWDADNSGAIVKESVYLRDINKIVDVKLAALVQEAEKQNTIGAAHDKSNSRYVELNGELDVVRQDWVEANANAQKYASLLSASQNYNVNNYLTTTANAIATAQTKLDAAKAEFTCVDFKWGNTLTLIEQGINNANTPLWVAVTTSYHTQATKAYYDAYDALNNGKNHSNADGFAASLRKLKTRLNKLVVVDNGDTEAGEEFVAEAEDIISNAEALFKAIVDAEYTAGDITGTGDITTDDYEALIDLLGQIEDAEDFDNPAYDVNCDGSVTMADVATIIDLIMGRTSDSTVMARMPMINTNNAIYVVKTATNNGISRYALILNNTAELFGAQMDIVLSNGMEIVNEGVAERTSGNEFYGSTTYSGKHRIILSSINMNTFEGSEGAIVYIDVRGEGELNLDNVLGVDTAGRMYYINVMTNVTGIESISADGKNADIYNVAGQKLNRTQRGAVNIIRTADGKTSKVINK